MTPACDIGHLISKHKLNKFHNFTDDEIRGALERRWIPGNKNEFPMSYHKKCGTWHSRSLGPQHTENYNWLAISWLTGYNGAWYVMCIMFKTSAEGGGRVGKNGGGGKSVNGITCKPSFNKFFQIDSQG